LLLDIQHLFAAVSFEIEFSQNLKIETQQKMNPKILFLYIRLRGCVISSERKY